ncbi:uncharacterized protein [Rutidosis leptorrhynchoides]|uniref:uncharacterized protein isoform X1 n=1 Tax=Rutidosis leptorrhynchoides TaxID=125765 RepID=UPI003A9A3040
MAGAVVMITRLIHLNHRRQTLKPKSLSSSSSSSSSSSLILLSHHHQFIKFPSFGPPSTTMSVSAVTPTTNLPPPLVQHNPQGCWSEFANNVSGEWDGFGADFSVDGNPIELPENVVPNAYREWEVQVFDWQTQCPTLAQPNNSSLIYKLVKLLPTVGCEADAATRYTIDERIIGGVDNMVSSFAYHPTGSYTAVWDSTPNRTSSSTSFTKLLELEHCLINPNDKESRVRIVQIVGVEDNQNHKKIVLKNIKVFVEQWYGPFRNGEQLGGCAIRDSAFASTQALCGSQVSGVWEVSNSIATFQDDSPIAILQQLVTVDGIHKEVRDQQNLVLLPKNLWSSIQYDGEQTCCQVGWLLEPGRAITSSCIFSGNAKLKEIVTSSETATPGPAEL